MLNIEQQLTLSTRSNTLQEMIGNESDNLLYKYYLNDNHQLQDSNTPIEYGNYSELQWSEPAKSISSKYIKRVGIKTFPHVGAIGFVKLLHEERSHIFAPVHIETERTASPSLIMEETADTLIFSITPPEDTTYTCYRIILRLAYDALEYVTYENTLEVPKPAATGIYDIYCVGYVHEGSATSEDSNHIEVSITGTREELLIPAENSDIAISDIEVTEDGYVQFRRTDGFEKKSDNFINNIVGLEFTQDGKLQLNLQNGDTIISSNEAPAGGGSGAATLYLSPRSDLLNGTSSFTLHSDTELADGLTVACFLTSDNVSEIIKLDALNAEVTLTDVAVTNDEVSLQARSSAYMNGNGESEPLIVTCRDWMIMDYLGVTEGMTNANWSSDDGTTTLALGSLVFYYNGGAYNNAVISGNSFIGIGSSSEHIRFNRRDTYISTYYYQLIEAEDIKTMKIRWVGWTPYGSRSDPYKYEWECFIMETGDITIALIAKGNSVNFDGTFYVFGQQYKISSDQPYVTFYRQNKEGTEWETVYDKFDMNKSLQFYPLKVTNMQAKSEITLNSPSTKAIGVVLNAEKAAGSTEIVISDTTTTKASAIVVTPFKTTANTEFTFTDKLSTKAIGILSE